jgi:hypothetical protein
MYLSQDVTYVEDDIEVHNGRNQWKLRLRQRPVREVTSVLVDDVELDPTGWTVMDDFVLVRTDGASFPYGIANLVVTYDHGWDVAAVDSGDPEEFDLPADIRYVTLAIAARRYGLTGPEAAASSAGITGEQIGQYSYTADVGGDQSMSIASQGLLEDEQLTLDAYRVPAVQR